MHKKRCLKIRTLTESLQSCSAIEEKGTGNPFSARMVLETLHLRRGNGDDKDEDCDCKQPPSSSRVSFSLVYWRQHETIVGLSPGGISTIPTQTLGWACTDHDPVDVEKYESERGPRNDLEANMHDRLDRSRSSGARSGSPRQRIRNAKKAQESKQMKSARQSERYNPLGVVSSLFKKQATT